MKLNIKIWNEEGRCIRDTLISAEEFDNGKALRLDINTESGEHFLTVDLIPDNMQPSVIIDGHGDVWLQCNECDNYHGEDAKHSKYCASMDRIEILYGVVRKAYKVRT